MTIDIEEISHATTPEALGYAQDYYANYYDPLNPLTSFHRYDHSEHIEVLATWGYQGHLFVQSRIKLTVLYALPSDWTDEIAMRGWIFWRNPITGVWSTEVESEATSVHHWQEAHQHIKEEATHMALKRAKITTYYPATHTADLEIYPHPGETMEAVPLAPEIGPILAALLPDCTLAIFYDTDPPSAHITSLLDGLPPAWVNPALIKIDDHLHFQQHEARWALLHLGDAFPTDPPPVEGQPFWRTDLAELYAYHPPDWLLIGPGEPPEPPPPPPQWHFTEDLEGWVETTPPFTFFAGDGYPFPGSAALGTSTSTGESPEFDSSAAPTINVTFYRLHIYGSQSTLALDAWDGYAWHNVWSETRGAHGWEQTDPIDISAYANPNMKIRFRVAAGSGNYRTDTVVVTYA